MGSLEVHHLVASGTASEAVAGIHDSWADYQALLKSVRHTAGIAD